MSMYILGSLARVFEGIGFVDKPEPGNVKALDVMLGAAMIDMDGQPDAGERKAMRLLDLLDPDTLHGVTVLDAEQEAAFWEGYNAQKPFRRQGRPYKGDEPRRQRTVWMTDSDRLTLKIAGHGNMSDGLRRILEEYTRLPETDDGSQA